MYKSKSMYFSVGNTFLLHSDHLFAREIILQRIKKNLKCSLRIASIRYIKLKIAMRTSKNPEVDAHFPQTSAVCLLIKWSR